MLLATIALFLTLLIGLGVFLRSRYSPAQHGLYRGEARVLVAWCEAALSTVTWTVPMERVQTALGQQMNALPSRVRGLLGLGLVLFDFSPMLVLYSPRRYASLSLSERVQVSKRIEHSKLSLLAMLQDAIATLGMIAIAGDKEVLARLGIDREAWIKSMQEERARALS